MSIDLAKIDGKSQKFKTEKNALDFFSRHNVSLTTPTKDKKGNAVFILPHVENFVLQDTEVKASTRMPGAPFTTSTLQQEASRKLGY